MTPDECLTCREIAAKLKVSRQTAMRLFERERGVIVIGSPETMHKRQYRVLRVPREVYERVVRSLSVK